MPRTPADDNGPVSRDHGHPDAGATSAKADLRAAATAARRARSDDMITAARAAVRRQVLERSQAQRWRVVAGYVPLRTEPGSVELLDALTAGGVRVLVPQLLADRDLDWSAWPDGTAETLGVDALADADAVLVPALLVDRSGMRLGRGGGSYDRALARVPAGRPVIALLFDGELTQHLPADAWDRRVTAVITPSGWHDLPAGNAAAR